MSNNDLKKRKSIQSCRNEIIEYGYNYDRLNMDENNINIFGECHDNNIESMKKKYFSENNFYRYKKEEFFSHETISILMFFYGLLTFYFQYWFDFTKKFFFLSIFGTITLIIASLILSKISIKIRDYRFENILKFVELIICFCFTCLLYFFTDKININVYKWILFSSVPLIIFLIVATGTSFIEILYKELRVTGLSAIIVFFSAGIIAVSVIVYYTNFLMIFILNEFWSFLTYNLISGFIVIINFLHRIKDKQKVGLYFVQSLLVMFCQLLFYGAALYNISIDLDY